jgi:hypothetical protein
MKHCDDFVIRICKHSTLSLIPKTQILFSGSFNPKIICGAVVGGHVTVAPEEIPLGRLSSTRKFYVFVWNKQEFL